MDSIARPMRLNARTTSTTQTPGEPRYHQAPCEMAPEEKPCSRIEPHDTAVGSPRPRKDSVVSDRIEMETASVVFASTSDMTFGSTWRVIWCTLPAPSAFDRSR